MNIIGRRLGRKVLETLKKMSTESIDEHEAWRENQSADEDTTTPEPVTDFDEFYTQYKDALKIACIDDETNRDRVAKLLRFTTNKRDLVTLDEYIQDMEPGQTPIYYMSGENTAKMMNTPLMEIYNKKDIEVLFLTGHADEPCVSRLATYEEKPLVSIEKGDLRLERDEEDKMTEEALRRMYKPLTEFLAGALKGKVASVAVSSRLVNDPFVVVAPEWGYSAYGERMIRSQSAGDQYIDIFAKMKTLEINPSHPIVKNMLSTISSGGNTDKITGLVDVFFDAALIASGFETSDPMRIASVIYRGAALEMGLDPNEEVKDVVISDEFFILDESDEASPEDEFGDFFKYADFPNEDDHIRDEL
eukprot:GHVO01064927.1.p2 GENE.GHVO01064927.1~~GHVO01064927.1.p2  ORF type:complete len:407 (+),score=93.26 GHVO01064927.1:141-1223(+)